MTRYQIAVRDYIKEAGGMATVADIIAFCCSIPQLERLERDGYVKIDGVDTSTMGSYVAWVDDRASFMRDFATTVMESVNALPVWKPKCEFCCDTGFIDWRMEKPAVPCTECTTYTADTRHFPTIGRRR